MRVLKCESCLGHWQRETAEPENRLRRGLKVDSEDRRLKSNGQLPDNPARRMVSFDPEWQIGPNPYAEWSDEELVSRWNGFDHDSPAMEAELLRRGYVPLREGRPNRKLVPGDLNELEAAHVRGEHETSLS
jgi:hypothetical protein